MGSLDLIRYLWREEIRSVASSWSVVEVENEPELREIVCSFFKP